MSLYVAGLAVYPLKSAAGIRVEEARLTPWGLEWDRRWMLVDDQGCFVTQRQMARMALLRVSVENGILQVAAPDMPLLSAIPVDPTALVVTVWSDRVQACTVSAAADEWFTRFLGKSVRLVFFPQSSHRTVDPAWAGTGHCTSFSDGFPLLVTSTSGMDALSELWGKSVDWLRFRPNIVIGGSDQAFAEDDWSKLQINGTNLALVKPCSRCVIPSIDPATSNKDKGFLEMLASVRRQSDGKVYLGQNAIIVSELVEKNTWIHSGDAVSVLASRCKG
ncbi:hypothetical protein EV700_1658 [Fluviicoccus keumensis]|uniref:MOSC domain-containing protein n=1 Tax=Fluviicoccus keumensis TaxID=1435465 RepID=A0A4Q7Z3K9_9GAMM|nr:MOSC N-terminal beta barrel domain-containing protein [Fluviicoccus keumensis]RZU44857.1 hypothetical protein EV700_1658 [Fluviicoccus keumensis]